jgi:hypothetical protein
LVLPDKKRYTEKAEKAGKGRIFGCEKLMKDTDGNESTGKNLKNRKRQDFGVRKAHE